MDSVSVSSPGTEMFLYELCVDEQFRHHGIGTALVEGLRNIAISRGCFGMWVITHEQNHAGLAPYAGTGAEREGGQAALAWTS